MEAIAMYGGMMGGWGAWFMTVNTLLVVGLLVAAAVALYRLVQRSDRDTGSMSRAEQLLAERYVRGEIDRAEFEERRSTLRAS
jgi:putative membrane protein